MSRVRPRSANSQSAEIRLRIGALNAIIPIAEAFWLLFGVHRPAGRALGAER